MTKARKDLKDILEKNINKLPGRFVKLFSYIIKSPRVFVSESDIEKFCLFFNNHSEYAIFQIQSFKLAPNYWFPSICVKSWKSFLAAAETLDLQFEH